MTQGDGPLAPESIAAAVAPIIDRLRLTIARQMPIQARDLLEEHRLDMVQGQVVGMLRNLLPDRVADRDSIRSAFRYWPPGQVDDALDRLVADGLLAVSADAIGLDAAGEQLLRSLRARIEVFVDELWSGHTGSVTALAELVGRALSAAEPTGGPSFALVHPVFEPEGTSVAMVLAERLTPLRFHRADAHAAAWEAAGLTAADAQALGPGEQRDAVEADTNRRAGAAYASLSLAERFDLVAGLGSLPG